MSPATPLDGAPLLLRAVDAEGLVLAAACLQDEVARVQEMAYLASERRFALLIDRFRWERRKPRRGARLERVRAAVCFDRVTRVRRRGLGGPDKPAALELLTVAFAPTAAGGGTIDLVFAGGATIRLEVEGIACQVEDLGAPVPSPVRPRHRLD